MKLRWEKAVACIEDTGVIFSLEDNGYAIVINKEKAVSLVPHWFGSARYYPIGYLGLADRDLINEAKDIINEYDCKDYDNFVGYVTRLSKEDGFDEIENEQEELLKQSKEKEKYVFI